MKKSILIIAIIFLFSSLLFAYPIQPRPLRKMVMESEFIVHGRVLKLGTLKAKKGEDTWNRDYAIIVINEVLQGSIATDTIKVLYTASMVCPAPPEYIVGQEAIIFLDRNGKNLEAFETHALSYGVKNISHQEGIAAYKQRISEMQSILKMTNAVQKQEAIIDWLVKCASNKYTCWEGVYELSPESDFMSFYDHDKELPKEVALNANQRLQLMDALMKTDTLGYEQLGLVDIVHGLNDAKLLDFLKTQLLLLSEGQYWRAEFMMQRIVRMTRDSELELLFKTFTDISDFDEKKQNERKALFAQFIDKMKNAELKQPVYAMGETDA